MGGGLVNNTAEQIWDLISPVIEELGFKLFDLEVALNKGHPGVLRVFIWRGKGHSITLDECATVSKRIDQITQLDEIFPATYTLEVSSPGINRKLSRPEHFSEALGERVKLVTDGSGGLKAVIRGEIKAVKGVELEVQDEESKAPVLLELSKVKKAQVDFKF